jgi:glutathione S-transferase
MSPTLHAHPTSSYRQKALTAPHQDAARWLLERMPVRVDAGRTVVEWSIIGEYLALRHSGPVRRLPSDPVAALEVRTMDRFFDGYGTSVAGTQSSPSRLDPSCVGPNAFAT